MNPLTKRRLGRSDVEVTIMGLGGATLGDAYETISERQAEETLAAAYYAGLGLFDTAPWYGNTLSEHRFGHLLRQQPRDSFVLTTKVGRIYSRPSKSERTFYERWRGGLEFGLRFDYTSDGIMRSFEDSLQRLGINRVDGLAIHDLDIRHQGDEAGIAAALDQLDHGGGYAALCALKDAGEIRAIGAGINYAEMIPRFIERFELDYFLVAMPYTLMDQNALDEALPLCEAHGVGVIIGAPFASGILASGPRPGALYGYQPAEEEVFRRVETLRAICQRYQVPLGAAALQFPLAHPCVASVIPGPDSPAQLRANLQWLGVEIPQALWEELMEAGIIRKDAPVPEPIPV